MRTIVIPCGRFAAEDAAAAKRRQIAELLRRGEDVHVTASGRLVDSKEAEEKEKGSLKAPEGKMA